MWTTLLFLSSIKIYILKKICSFFFSSFPRPFHMEPWFQRYFKDSKTRDFKFFQMQAHSRELPRVSHSERTPPACLGTSASTVARWVFSCLGIMQMIRFLLQIRIRLVDNFRCSTDLDPTYFQKRRIRRPILPFVSFLIRSFHSRRFKSYYWNL